MLSQYTSFVDVVIPRTGYDLTRLLIGTEGTIAVITEATLKLHGAQDDISDVNLYFMIVVYRVVILRNSATHQCPSRIF